MEMRVKIIAAATFLLGDIRILHACGLAAKPKIADIPAPAQGGVFVERPACIQQSTGGDYVYSR